MPEPDLLGLLDRGLCEAGFEPSPSQLQHLMTLAQQLERWGARINLTGYRDAETIVRRLVLDAAALLVRLPQFSSLVDLGAGAGFPGIPMAVLAPDRRFILVESRERRHFFQREMIRKLDLRQVEAIHGRFDELEPVRCDAVVAQAVGAPSVLVAKLVRWVRPGGLLIVPGGARARLAESSEISNPRSVEYSVPLEGPARTIWLAEASPRSP